MPQLQLNLEDLDNKIANLLQQAMEAAKQQAELAYNLDEVPVGACLFLPNGQAFAEHNKAKVNRNCLCHAEVLAIESARAILARDYLQEACLCVTLEPCAMCATIIAKTRIKCLYFGDYDLKGGAVENGVRWLNHPSANFKVEWYGGLSELQNSEPLRKFFAVRRSQKNQK